MIGKFRVERGYRELSDKEIVADSIQGGGATMWLCGGMCRALNVAEQRHGEPVVVFAKGGRQ